MKNYQKINNIVGWFTFILASLVFLLTAEPTASWWDCGEYIATSTKMMVGHPPGAPTFQLIARLFSLLAGNDTSHWAVMVNSMSALCSGFTILFLFWSITLLAKKLVVANGEMTTNKMIIILASGFVGGMAYTFSDSFWFSAVEGEVYAMSSFFTALVVWVVLKWESVSDEKHSFRWIILLSLLIGISIGVHLLNLLAIPAIVFVYYYKKFKPTVKGSIIAFVLSVVMLATILFGIIPMIVNLAGKMEKTFVNDFGLPFNTGTIFYFILLIAIIVFGIRYAIKKKNAILHAIILSFVFILIGYSTFFVLVIRANAGTPINENNPSDAVSLLSYLNREQYGENPLMYGQYYTAKPINQKEGSVKYVKGKTKYEAAAKSYEYEYDDKDCTPFPRMYSNDDGRAHPTMYKVWTGIHGDRKPGFSENISFFWNYQLGHMYFRYFMWNFAGRQNDIQGHGYDQQGNKDLQNGNWISGINFIDAMRLGNQDKVQQYMKDNRARNKFYFIPLILGLIGMFYHIKKNRKDAFIVFLLFFFTGLAIAIYLNMPPMQPRERDYAFAGSFYAFAFWIGLGVMAIYDFFKKYKLPETASVGLAIALSLTAPYLMGEQGWGDHNRANRYSCRDVAVNTLESCAPNGILITNGDNDTFPLWYAQEVEGVRTDVKVLNYTLASGAWYVQELFRQMYKCEPLPFTLPVEKYRLGTNDWMPIKENGVDGFLDLHQAFQFINSDNPDAKVAANDGEMMSFFPTNKVQLTIDSAYLIKAGIVPKDKADKMYHSLQWTIGKQNLYKNEIMLLDLLGTNNWKRPIYFENPSSAKNVAEVTDYCPMEGLVYHLLPYAMDNHQQGFSGVNTAFTYDFLMNKCKWGNLNDPHVYVDPESMRSAFQARNQYARLAQALVIENKKDSAIKVLNKSLEFFPNSQVPFDMYLMSHVQLYYMAGGFKDGNKLALVILDHYLQDIIYYESLDRNFRKNTAQGQGQAYYVLRNMLQVAQQYNQTEVIAKTQEILKAHPESQQ